MIGRVSSHRGSSSRFHRRNTVDPTPTPTPTPTATPTPTPTPTQNIVSSDLILHLDANNSSSYGGSGNTWVDIAGTQQNITLTGSPTYTSGSPSYFTFNGVNQYGLGSGVVIPTTGYTKSVWVYLNGYADNNIVSGDGHFMFMGAGGTDHKIYCGHANWTSPSSYLDYPSTNTVNLNTWYNLTLTFNTTDGMKLYINGVLDSTYTARKTAHPGTGTVNLATYAGGNLLNGRISKVYCYSRSLTSQEVSDNYNNDAPLFGLSPIPTPTPTPTTTPTPTPTPTDTPTPTPTPTNNCTPISGTPRVLFLGDSNVSTVASNVSSYCTATGNSISYSAVTMSTTYAGAGLTNENYDVVVIYTNSSQTGAAGLSTALTNFVNGGGHVVSGVFVWNLYASGFPHSGVTPFNVTNTQSNNSTGNFTVSTTSPITNGIGTSFGGFSFTNTNPTLASGATLYASYSSDSTRLLAVKTSGCAKLIGINTWFASISSSTSTLCKMVGNSILYASGKI